MEQFGERLRRLRGDRSQKSVAEELGIPQTTLSSLEKQSAVPRGDLLTKLAEFFDVPIKYFYDDYDEPKLQSSGPARAWLEKLRTEVRGRATIATHSRSPIAPAVRQRIAQRIKEKYEEATNKKR